MSAKSNYTKKQKQICRDEWFKNHRAAMPGDCNMPPVITVIHWQQPGTWNYGARYIIHRRWLCVVGDIGEATFEWGQDITLDFLGAIDFDYFMGKCRASPEGRKFERFDTEVAWKELQDYMKERESEPSYSKEYDKAEKHLRETLTANACKDEWDDALREVYEITGDGEFASRFYSMGVSPSCHAIGMFVGLQMAIAQLQNKA